MPGLVIFDCDGVLVDSERLAIQVDARVLAKMGWPLTEREIIDRFVGVSDADFRRAVETQLGRELPEDWEAEFEPLYREAFAAELCAVEGITEALDTIDRPTCVASSGSHDKMRFTLGLTGLYQRFEGRIFSATEVAHGKPAADLFLHAAARMGVSPADCVVVEDSVNGVRAARAAGMAVLAYAGGVTPADRLEGPGTLVFTDMRDLPALLERERCASHAVEGEFMKGSKRGGARLPAALLLSMSALLASGAETLAHPSANASAEELDEIIIRGASVADLQAAAIKAEDLLIARYNALNTDDDLDIRCMKYTPTGTRFTQRYCQTRLQSKAQQKDGSELLNFMQSFDVQNGQAPPLPLMASRLLASWHQYRATVVRLLEENPDLRALVIERAAAIRRYEAARRRK